MRWVEGEKINIIKGAPRYGMPKWLPMAHSLLSIARIIYCNKFYSMLKNYV
jgi:hypothetical protein